MYMSILFTHTDRKVDNLDNDLFFPTSFVRATPPKRRGVRSCVATTTTTREFVGGFIDVRLSGWSVHLCVLGVSRIWIGLLSTEN